MRPRLSRVLAGLAGLTIVLTTQGCELHVSSNDHGPSSDCSAVSYDLTVPPSRAELGMPAGLPVLDRSCDAGFDVTLKLPEGTTTSLTARRVNADSYSTDHPATDPPTTVDVHSVALSTDDAIRLATRLAGDLGVNPDPLQAWRQQVEGGTGDSVDSPFLRNRLGYLTVELQVQHLGVSGNNYLHLVLSWS